MDKGTKLIGTPGLLERFWTVTSFNESEIDAFAIDVIRKETCSSIQLMTLLFFFLLVTTAFLDRFIHLGGPPFSAYLLLAVLCLHVLLVSFRSQDLDVLYLLAISLLMISSTTLVLMAHQSGDFNTSFYTGVALIFIFIPFIPWGLREASLVSLLIYLVITLSILSSKQKFSSDSIILLQFFMLSIAIIVLTLVGKNTGVRRNEIMGLFGLQKSHGEMQLLSYKDPLTDIWNRRYLLEKFYEFSNRFSSLQKNFYFILIDIDHFKEVNDTYGHDYGDHFLQWTAESFARGLIPGDLIFRMGGDEFALIIGAEPLQCLQAGLSNLYEEVEKIGKVDHSTMSLSLGMVTVEPGDKKDFREIYKMADKALYAAKRHKGSWLVSAEDGSATDLGLNIGKASEATLPPGANK